MKLDILFEDDFLIVVNKPADLLSVPDRYNAEIPNLTALLGQRYGDPIIPVHRLDKPTSGAIIYARTKEAHKEMNRQFQEREVDKIYHAIVEGQPGEGETEVDEPIANNPAQTGKMMVSNKGKYALSIFKQIESFGRQFSLVAVQIFTGRTHQVRVHLAYAGFPLMVDPFYGKREAFMLSEIKGRKYNLGRDKEERPLLNRVPLHATKVSFDHPSTGERMTFEASYPKDMRAVINQLRKLGR
ncbi:RluA family pseudouridine synthase [Neolewinella antarctica]|uniref:Pseudouridine synthase n=1 Tax=Neolewinella antarctica TaxID=442734 RepID=A0ABX0X813_9BACT|nr:RluA family pseudouridine synthase [Neolewinella antarctica]NJC25360.1 RluA family pseudouridine synthase [Neolewinella antarctica]